MILVVGATGDLGGRVVRLLREREESVRCLVRPATDDAELRAVGAQVVRGDLVDAPSLVPACDGVQIVVATATAIARNLSGQRRPSLPDVDENGMSGLVDAAERAGVERFVYVSMSGISDALGSPLERAKIAIERRLEESSMRTSILRPDAFHEIHLSPIGRFDIANRKVAVFGSGDTKRRWVSTADVAGLLAAVATEPNPEHVLEFGGAEAISRNELITLAESIIGRPIKRTRLPQPAARLGMRLLAKRNPALASVFGAGIHQDRVPARWDDKPLREHGIVPTSASDYIRKTAAEIR